MCYKLTFSSKRKNQDFGIEIVEKTEHFTCFINTRENIELSKMTSKCLLQSMADKGLTDVFQTFKLR